METVAFVLLAVAFVLLVITIDQSAKVIKEIGRLRDRVRSLESVLDELNIHIGKADRLQTQFNDSVIKIIKGFDSK